MCVGGGGEEMGVPEAFNKIHTLEGGGVVKYFHCGRVGDPGGRFYRAKVSS